MTSHSSIINQVVLPLSNALCYLFLCAFGLLGKFECLAVLLASYIRDFLVSIFGWCRVFHRSRSCTYDPTGTARRHGRYIWHHDGPVCTAEEWVSLAFFFFFSWLTSHLWSNDVFKQVKHSHKWSLLLKRHLFLVHLSCFRQNRPTDSQSGGEN